MRDRIPDSFYTTTRISNHIKVIPALTGRSRSPDDEVHNLLALPARYIIATGMGACMGSTLCTDIGFSTSCSDQITGSDAILKESFEYAYEVHVV